MLEFVDDAICLSGLAGTKLKCDVLGSYYPFWWNITSGGQRANHAYSTAIIELHAGTGEVYIKDLKQIVLGSSGHALELKASRAPTSDNLKVVLVEENSECCLHLKNVIRRRWPEIPVERIEGPWVDNISKNVYLLNRSLDEVLPIVRKIRGNAVYFFDPLRSVDWSAVDKVASNRIKNFYQTGTEFIIFSFTSDWFLGRDKFSPLPNHQNEKKWSDGEKQTIDQADALFGDTEWRNLLLCNESVTWKEKILIEIYKNRLRKWFRYILPLPFNPKKYQLFHLVICSNYEAGVRMNRQFYSSITDNPLYSPDSKQAFKIFKGLYPKLFKGLSGNRRPLPWKVLWKIIVQHEDGVCDKQCRDLNELDNNINNIQNSLDWLCVHGYLDSSSSSDHWEEHIPQYVLNWNTVKEKLGVTQPIEFRPASQEQVYQKMAILKEKQN
ncbi:three-Cys-motif partner protein TcmP [bacterium]|nr:three-Cys-motif partner protein TcmP [bacterium]